MALGEADLEVAGGDLKFGQAFVVKQARKLADQFEIDGVRGHARTVSGAKGAAVGLRSVSPAPVEPRKGNWCASPTPGRRGGATDARRMIGASGSDALSRIRI